MISVLIFKQKIKEKLPRLFKLLKQAKYLFYPHGFCPFCNEIVPLRAGGRPYPRKGEVCVNCESMARHRFLFYVYKVSFLSRIDSGCKILHFAPELPLYKLLSKRHDIEYVCADINPKQYPFAKECKKMNALQIPYQDETFDVVLANHLIEHVDEQLFLKEMYRITKKDGIVLLSTPVYIELEKTLEDPAISTPQQRKQHYGHPEHLRKYGADAATRFSKIFNVNYISYKDLPPFGDKVNSNCFILTKKEDVPDI